MLDGLIQMLSEYEPTINSIVGLVTLGAAVWGLLQLTGLARSKSQASVTSHELTENRGDQPGAWSTLINLGLGRGSQLEELVSVRSVNVALFLLLGISFAWLVVSLFSRATILLTAINLLVFVASLIGFAMQLSGRNGTARFITLLVIGFYWLVLMLAIGPIKGVEYYIVLLMAFPILIFTRSQRGQMYLAMLLMGLLFIVSILLQQIIPPLLHLSEVYLQRGYFLNVLLLSSAIFLAVRYNKEFAATNYNLLEDQKRQNDNLVSNMLPEHIANRVYAHEETVAEWHPDATVLLGSIHGIDSLYKKMSAVQLVQLLSEIFLCFDKLVAKHGVDKVRTLGSNYLVATGIGQNQEPDPQSIAACALEMREAVEAFSAKTTHSLSFQAGIAHGHAASGVIGEARICFDIWGEAVEMASRMRNAAASDIVLVDESAFWRLHDNFELMETEVDTAMYQLLGERKPDG